MIEKKISASTLKNFEELHDEYAFFQLYSTESSACSDILASQLKNRIHRDEIFSLADYGSGAGDFTAAVLKKLNASKSSLKIALFEPDINYLQNAVELIQPFSSHSILGERAISHHPLKVDAVLSNHVLYYVPKLSETLEALLSLLSSKGALFITLANNKNSLIKAWNYLFSLLGRRRPYHTAESLLELLNTRRGNFSSHSIKSELRFPDTRENRIKILRFLLGQHFSQFSELQEPLKFFDQYKIGSEIFMPLVDELLIISA